MHILFLAPQPFFQERGTPIAVKLALEVLSERVDYAITLLTYHGGRPLPIGTVNHQRICAPEFLKDLRPGISLKKLCADVFLFFSAWKLIRKAKKGGKPFTVIHAVEESVFMALFFKLLYGIPFLYDMDSALSLQLTDSWKFLRPLRRLLEWCERLAMKHCLLVVPVCDSLKEFAEFQGSRVVAVLHDISLLKKDPNNNTPSLREELGISSTGKLVVYIGNLEGYQGIDLLLEAFALVAPQFPEASLLIIGGPQVAIEKYQAIVSAAQTPRIYFVGPKPVVQLADLIEQADILVSPRSLGNNTPMKIYSYLDAGKPIVATNLPTHTQVLTPEVSILAEPTAQGFADGMATALAKPELCRQLSENAQKLAQEKYTLPAFRSKLLAIYTHIEETINHTTT